MKTFPIADACCQDNKLFVPPSIPGARLLQEAAQLTSAAQEMERRAQTMIFRAAILEERFQKNLCSQNHFSAHAVYRRVHANRCTLLGVPVPSCPPPAELADIARAMRKHALQVREECRLVRENCERQRSALQAAVESSRIALEMARSRMDAGRVLALSNTLTI